MQHLIFKQVTWANNTKAYIKIIHKADSQNKYLFHIACKPTYIHSSITMKHQEQQNATVMKIFKSMKNKICNNKSWLNMKVNLLLRILNER